MKVSNRFEGLLCNGTGRGDLLRRLLRRVLVSVQSYAAQTFAGRIIVGRRIIVEDSRRKNNWKLNSTTPQCSKTIFDELTRPY